MQFVHPYVFHFPKEIRGKKTKWTIGGLDCNSESRGVETYREDEVRHVAIASDDLEAGHGVGVANHVGDLRRAVLLHPWDVVLRIAGGRRGRHRFEPLALVMGRDYSEKKPLSRARVEGKAGSEERRENGEEEQRGVSSCSFGEIWAMISLRPITGLRPNPTSARR